MDGIYIFQVSDSATTHLIGCKQWRCNRELTQTLLRLLMRHLLHRTPHHCSQSLQVFEAVRAHARGALIGQHAVRPSIESHDALEH